MPETSTPKPAAKKAAAATPNLNPAQAVWDRLAAEFPQDQLERLPKPLKARDDNRGRCDEDHAYYSADGYYCGGWHARSVHLTYVGHAGITTRLNDVLGPGGWEFKPYALNQFGLPLIQGGEFWATLTIKVLDQEPVTKMDLAANFSSTQEALGDALRRCAMRFGVGTYLWSKSEAAHAKAQFADPEPEPDAPSPEPQPQALRRDQQILADRVDALPQESRQKFVDWWSVNNLPPLGETTAPQVAWVMEQMDKRETAANTEAAPDPS